LFARGFQKKIKFLYLFCKLFGIFTLDAAFLLSIHLNQEKPFFCLDSSIGFPLSLKDLSVFFIKIQVIELTDNVFDHS